MVEPIFSGALMSIKGIPLLILLGVLFFVMAKLRGKDEKSPRYIVTTALGGGIGFSLLLTLVSIFVYLIKGVYLVPWFCVRSTYEFFDKYLVIAMMKYQRPWESGILIRWDLDAAILFIIGFSLISALILIIAPKISKR